MTLIELFHQDEGHGLLDTDHPYTLRVSYGFDESGNWVPQWARGFDTLTELREAVFSLIRLGDFFCLRGSEHFTPLAMELGLQPSVREWGLGAFHPHQIVPLMDPAAEATNIPDFGMPEDGEQEAA